MTADRWRRLTEVFDAAMAQEPSSREAFVREACGTDVALAGEVLSLLSSPESAAAFLSTPAVPGQAPAPGGATTTGPAGLTPGEMLGQYRIEAFVGRGGMGEVYRARDLRLDRDVAIKILPASVIADPGRLARFESEARVLASLNHPSIGAIYGVEERAGLRALVLEFVEGRTLAQVVPLPIPDALHVARQIAHALEAAHERGIVHRDLKPTNIKITPDGVVKLLDFGLAKVQPPPAAGPSSALEAQGLTEEGLVLGTVAYMSPEQARGRTVDKRTDIWAFGCVLFEMLTGRRLHTGESAPDVLVAILDREPDWSTLPVATPAAIRRLLVQCLEKDPKRRLRDIGDAHFGLDDDGGASSAPLSVSRRQWLASAAVPAVLAFAAGRFWAPAPSPAPRYRRVTFRRGMIWSARFSTDGEQILYSATWEGSHNQIYSTRLENPESRPLGQADADILSVSRSGDLALILKPFHRGGFTRGTLAVVGSSAVAPRPIREDVVAADWAPDGQTLAIVCVVDGAYRIEFPPGRVLHESAGRIVDVRVAPDGRSVAFSDLSSIAVAAPDQRVQVLSDDWAAAYAVAWSGDGREVWFSASRLDSGRATSAVHVVSRTRKLRTALAFPVGVSLRDRTRDGRLLTSVGLTSKGLTYRDRRTGAERDLSWLDWGLVADLSLDGAMLLFSEGGQAGAVGRATYIRPVDGGPADRLGSGAAEALSPDSKTALALQDQAGFVSLVALSVGPGSPRTLTEPGLTCTGARFLPDGRRILLAAAEPGRPVRTWLLDPDRGSREPLTPEGVAGVLGSPDGVWFLAGRPARVYPLRGGPPRAIPGLTTADVPVGWDGDGRHIYVRRDFQADDENRVSVFRIDVATGDRVVWYELYPEPVRAATSLPMAIARDGSMVVYTYMRILNDLHVIDEVS